MAAGVSEQGRRRRLSVTGLGLVTIAAYGVAYYSYGVLIDPIRTQTGWSSPGLGAVFSGVLVIGGAGGLIGGRLVDRFGTRPVFLFAGTVGAGAVALASYQHDLLAFALPYAAGCGVIAALGFYHVTQPAAIRDAPGASERAVVWLTVLGAFASPIFDPLTAALVDGIGWRDTIRVLAGIAAIVFLGAGVAGRGARGESTVGGRSDDRGRRAAERVGIAWLSALGAGVADQRRGRRRHPRLSGAGDDRRRSADRGGRHHRRARGFAQLGGRVPLSPLLRRLGARQTIVVSFLAGGVGTIFLLARGHVAPAIAYSILAGASIGAMYTLQGIYTNELVGPDNLSLLMGAQQAVFAVPWLRERRSKQSPGRRVGRPTTKPALR